ncbi:hypothetical protein CSPARA_0992 [Campylobacter sputorum bv. paraureolyticus LMG 11764]|nr:hypothetical protein CSPARA_0992 [Campylobacter sputorum bv. paraureolyticus LMG 11764]
MDKLFNLIFIYGYFFILYIGLLMGYFIEYSYKFSLAILFIFNILVFIKICILIKFKKNIFKTIKIFFIMLFFAIFIVYFIFFERFIMSIFLISINKDYLHTNLLTIELLSTLYYPIYIFIFLMPFVTLINKIIMSNK